MQAQYKDSFAVRALHPRPEGRGFPHKLINHLHLKLPKQCCLGNC